MSVSFGGFKVPALQINTQPAAPVAAAPVTPAAVPGAGAFPSAGNSNNLLDDYSHKGGTMQRRPYLGYGRFPSIIFQQMRLSRVVDGPEKGHRLIAVDMKIEAVEHADAQQPPGCEAGVGAEVVILCWLDGRQGMVGPQLFNDIVSPMFGIPAANITVDLMNAITTKVSHKGEQAAPLPIGPLEMRLACQCFPRPRAGKTTVSSYAWKPVPGHGYQDRVAQAAQQGVTLPMVR